MKRQKKSMIVAVLIGIMLLFTGCGKGFNAKGMVEAYMDLATKGETENYCRMTGVSKEEAEGEYQQMLDEITAEFEDSNISKEVAQDLTDAFAQLLSKAKYEVQEATKNGDEYEVSVDIYPMKGMLAGYEEALNDVIEDISADSSLEEVYDAVFSVMTEVMLSNMDQLSYGDPKTIDLKIVKNGKVYEVDNEEEIFEQIGMMLFDDSEFN